MDYQNSSYGCSKNATLGPWAPCCYYCQSCTYQPESLCCYYCRSCTYQPQALCCYYCQSCTYQPQALCCYYCQSCTYMYDVPAQHIKFHFWREWSHEERLELIGWQVVKVTQCQGGLMLHPSVPLFAEISKNIQPWPIDKHHFECIMEYVQWNLGNDQSMN